MKLNHDCVRDVLLFVEEEQRPGIFLHLNDFISIQDKDTSTKKRLSMYDAETIKWLHLYKQRTVSFQCLRHHI